MTDMPQRGTPDGSVYPPLSDADWPDEIADLRDTFAGQLNVYRVMAHRPELLRAWVPLRRHVVERSALGEARLEVVILRTAHRLGSRYEWAHHVARGRACGVSDARIETLRGALADMDEEDAVLARAVDDLVDGARLSPAGHEALKGLAGDDGVFDLIATVGFYFTLGCLVNSFDTPIDPSLATS